MAAPVIAYMGHEGFFAFAPEINPPVLPGVSTLPTGPDIADYQLVGYTNLPSFETDKGAMGIEAVPAYQDVDTIQTLNNHSYSGTVTLAASAQTQTLLDAVFRSTEVAWAQTTLGLPVFSVATGYINEYETGRGETIIGRGSMINSFNFSARTAQPLTANFEIWSQFLQSGALLDSSIGADEEGASLFHEALTWSTLTCQIGADSYRHTLESVELGISNNLQRRGVRPIYTSTPAPLSLTPEWIQPGKQTNTLTIGFHTPIPDALKGKEIGPIVMAATGYYGAVLKTLQITITNAAFASCGRQAAGPNDPAMYQATFQIRNVSAEWV